MKAERCYFTGCKFDALGRCNYRIDHFGTECGNPMCSTHVKQAAYATLAATGKRIIDPAKPAHCLAHEPPHNQARLAL